MPIELSAAQAKSLRELERALPAIEAEIARAERAGLPIAEQRAELHRLVELRRNLLREYSPRGTRPASA